MRTQMLEHLYLHETNEYASNTTPYIHTQARTHIPKHGHILEAHLAIQAGNPARVRVDAPATLTAKHLQTRHNTQKAQNDIHIMHRTQTITK